MKLHELTNEQLRLVDNLIATGGEISPEQEAELGDLEEARTEKVSGYCKCIRSIETDAAVARAAADQMKAEMDRLRKLAQARENAATRLRAWLKLNLERMGLDRVECELFSVRIVANGGKPSVSYTGSVNDLPRDMQRVTIELDTDAVHAAIKAGKQLPVGVEVKRGTSLRIS